LNHIGFYVAKSDGTLPHLAPLPSPSPPPPLRQLQRGLSWGRTFIQTLHFCRERATTTEPVARSVDSQGPLRGLQDRYVRTVHNQPTRPLSSFRLFIALISFCLS
jgi:hypothetical protein